MKFVLNPNHRSSLSKTASLAAALGLTLLLSLGGSACLVPAAIIASGMDAGYNEGQDGGQNSAADASNSGYDSGSSSYDSGGGGNVTPGCNGKCDALQYTACTCDVSDPCGWIADGYCDQTSCQSITSSYFHDDNDCSGGGSGSCPANAHEVTVDGQVGCACNEGYIPN